MKRILHIDDDPELIAIVQHILGKHYTLLGVQDAFSLESELKRFQPDMVLADNFAGLLEPDSPLMKYAGATSIPVVLFSASPDVSVRAEELGLTGYIEKPASISYIRSYVENIFSLQ
ncbi:MAG: response regulator [Chitinophagaceae bacterium]